MQCDAGRPVLTFRGASFDEAALERQSGSVSMSLAESIGRIEALLPESIAPPGSRAVWTGESVLVATVVGRDVSVRRFQCELTQMVQSYF